VQNGAVQRRAAEVLAPAVPGYAKKLQHCPLCGRAFKECHVKEFIYKP